MIGKQIGRYRIDAELGKGGMGVVYRGTQVTLDRTVAIKMLFAHLADAENLERFRREALTLARVDHQNIVHVYDVEEVDGAHFIIMEFVGGPTLDKVMKQERPMSPARASDIVSQIAAGLAAAHTAGVVHRDIKPDNVLFNERGVPKITDFGIAHMKDAGSKTRTGVMLGTPYYMSPEQARGQPVTGAADIYAAGVMLFEMLSGDVPFTAADPISLALKHVQEDPPSLKERRPDLPDDLCALVHRALQKDPGDRFGTAEQFHDALVTGSWSTGRTTLGGTPIVSPPGAVAKPAATPAGGSVLERIRESVPLEKLDSLSDSLKTRADTGAQRLRASLGAPSFAGLPRAFWFGVIAIVFSGGFMAVRAVMDTGPGGTTPGRVAPRVGAGGPAAPQTGNSGGNTGGTGQTPGLTEQQARELDVLLGVGPDSTAEQRTPEQRTPEQRTPEQRTPEQRTPEQRTPEQRTPEQRTPEQRTPEREVVTTPPDARAAARQAILAIVERQRRATVNQDAELYARDIHADVRAEAMLEFNNAIAVATDFSSTVTDVEIDFVDDAFALVNFHMRLTARQRSNGNMIDVSEDAGWEMTFEDGRWWIVSW